MNYILWMKRCKVAGNPVLGRVANTTSSDIVRFLAWSGEELIRGDRFLCACDRCNNELSLVLMRSTERTLDLALDAEPVLVERTRHSDSCSNNTFVHLSFAHPSTTDTASLLQVLCCTRAELLYVTTAYDIGTGKEETSVFKINLVTRKTPGCVGQAEWIVQRIRAVTNCKATRFETRYVSYFSAFLDDVCPRSADAVTGRHARLGVVESLYRLQTNRQR